MKKTITISESELVRMVKHLMEEVNLEHFDDEDFLDAFFQLFRGWISRNHKKALEYPMSYLLKKYSKDFVIHYLGQEWYNDWVDEDDDDLVLSFRNAIYVIQQIIKKDKYKLPKLIHQEKFTDKYGQVIQSFITQELGYPDYVKIKLEEPNPHNFVVRVEIDVEKYLKDPNKFNLYPSQIERKLKEFMSNFLGMEFGYLRYGQSELHIEQVDFLNLESWIKNQLNGLIKKEFKKLPESTDVKSIKFQMSPAGGTLKLIFMTNANWSRRRPTKEAYQRKLNELGYGPNLELES